MPMGVRHHPMTCCSLDSTDTATMNREWCASSTRSVQPAVPTTRITPTPTETATSIAIPTAIPLRPTHQAQLHLIPRHIYAPIHRQPLLVSRRMLRQRAQHECSQVGAEVVCMLQSPVFQRFRKVLIGFSQGGYLSYRMTTEYPDVFDMAVLLSRHSRGKQRTRSLPAAHDSRFATAVMTVRFQSPTSSVPVSNLARPVVARISNIPAWRTTYVIRKLPTCTPGWDCEPWRVLTYHA